MGANIYEKGGLLDSSRRGYFTISKRGLEALAGNPKRIDVHFLSQYVEFVEFQSRKREKIDGPPTVDETPEEMLENAFQSLRQNLASELLQQIKTSPPHLFEKIVIELLVAMGYGGSLQDAGRAVGKTGDEGIDGIIKEDRLGLDIIYIQAKCWEGTVGRPEIQKFAGALQGQRAKKGIFITTSDFSKEAYDFASKIDSKIILMGGEELAQHMIDHNLGVSSVTTYEIKRMDSDYFTDE